MKILLTPIKMRLQGFKKVALKDTKGALTSANNYKWVNSKTNTTILPSGTKIQTFLDKVDYTQVKTVTKADGSLFRAFKFSDGSYKLYKKNVDGKMFLFKQKTPQEVIAEKARAAADALRQKREAFVEKFKKTFERTIIRDENDKITTKMLHDRKTGRLVHWFRNSNGNKSVGDIVYYPANLGKEVYVQTPDKYIIKTVLNGIGQRKVSKAVFPQGDITKAIVTENSISTPVKGDEIVNLLGNLADDFAKMAEKV